jgi:uncharacterized protein (DUF1684 family)
MIQTMPFLPFHTGLARMTLAAALGLAACSSGPPPPALNRPYAEEVRAHRQSKDQIFRTDAESPIPRAERASFSGLMYFDIDPAYQTPASLREERVNPPVIIELTTSSSTIDRLMRVGTLRFSLNGTPYTLTAFATEAEGLNRLFVPFGDLTNGDGTYKGGRYLNLDRTPTGLYDLDFNLAYNPYCVYNINYTCPIPPAENRMPLAVRAGERMP